MATATITIRLPLAEKKRAQRVAGKKNLSAWTRRLIRRELQPAQGVGWADHFATLAREGLRIEGHPEDQMIRQRR